MMLCTTSLYLNVEFNLDVGNACYFVYNQLWIIRSTRALKSKLVWDIVLCTIFQTESTNLLIFARSNGSKSLHYHEF